MVLLAASCLYYASFGLRASAFFLFTALMTHFCAVRMTDSSAGTGSSDNGSSDTHSAQSIKKRYLITGLICQFALLAYLKYAGFAVLNLNSLLSAHISVPQLLLPFGISYYTFQASAYLIDVSRGLVKAERNPLKTLLFLVFFPQLAQGPIGRFDRLSPQLFSGSVFQWHSLRTGAERIVWGLFKKMVVGDTAHVFRTAIFGDPETYAGAALFGTLFFSAELYANFSGGVDICIGIARLFGITLDENFKRPYFAKTLSEFWQRWHITLGSWMKDYVFYPLARTRAMTGLGGVVKKALPGHRLHRALPQGLCSVIVFTLVGLWHGADWGNIGWGFYNGLIICVSELIQAAGKGKRTVSAKRERSGFGNALRIARTFAIVNVSWYFTCADSVSHALTMIRYSLTRFSPAAVLQIPAGRPGTGTAGTPFALFALACGILLMLVYGILGERAERDEEKPLPALPLAASFVMYLLLLVSIPLLAPAGEQGAFIYSQF
ncbi:MAG: MBOAT family protein [Lachnospiraceae bacterium]|nr:MBOAT family protein [Lachnospiraceae bacterium]